MENRVKRGIIVHDPVFKFQFVSFKCLTNILLFWTFLCPVRIVYTDSMFNISKTFKKKTNIIERKKEANTLKAV